MIQVLLDVDASTPVPVMRERLGEVLGLEGPVPLHVLLRAVNEPGFANDLIICRESPDFLTALFDDPHTRSYQERSKVPAASAGELAGKAAGALTRWAKAGFSTVNEKVLEARETACLNCPHLIEPQSLLQQMVPVGTVSDRVGSRLGRKVCELCGCAATKKIRLPTEHCPDAHPVLGGQTRWNEPIREAALADQ